MGILVICAHILFVLVVSRIQSTCEKYPECNLHTNPSINYPCEVRVREQMCLTVLQVQNHLMHMTLEYGDGGE